MDALAIFSQAAELRLMAQRLAEAAAANNEEVARKYSNEAFDKAEAIKSDLELTRDNVMTSDGREAVARRMLNAYYLQRCRVRDNATRLHLLFIVSGDENHAYKGAKALLRKETDELERQTLQILELMGVDL